MGPGHCPLDCKINVFYVRIFTATLGMGVTISFQQGDTEKSIRRKGRSNVLGGLRGKPTGLEKTNDFRIMPSAITGRRVLLHLKDIKYAEEKCQKFLLPGANKTLSPRKGFFPCALLPSK